MMVVLLAGCAAVSVDPRITTLNPGVLQQGKAAHVTVQVEQWTPGTQLVLMPAGPYVTHQLVLPALPQSMTTDDSRAYLATDDRQLFIVDFPPQTGSARILGRLTLVAPAVQLHVINQRLLAVLANGSLQWWDVSRPAAPMRLATLAAPGRLLDVQVVDAGNIYLLLDAGAGMTQLQRWKFVSVSPRLDQEWLLPVAADAFAVRGQHLWTVGTRGIAVLDISGEQALLKDVQATSGISDDVQLQDQLALVADGRGGLVLFDISEPDVLQWRGSFNKRGAIRGFSVNKELVDDESALLVLRSGGVLRLGLDNPELPGSGAAFQTDVPIMLSTLQGDVALLATEYGLQRVMMLGGGDGAVSSEGLNLGGSRRGAFGTENGENILYVADWFSGLHLYDISNPRQLRYLSNYHTSGSSKGVVLLGNYALVGDDDRGLQIIDIEDPHRPRWVAELPPEAMARMGLAYTMKLVGKTLYLADHRGGFHIIDLTDIERPQRLGGYDTPGKAWDIDVADGIAFVADDRAGLLMFDVSDPGKPEPFAQFNPGGQAEAVALQNGRAYVAFFDKGLYTLDIGNPRQARVIGHTPIPGNARGLELGDGLVYVASWEAGLQIVDTRDSVVPRIIGSFDTDGAAWGVKVKDGYAYVLDWWGGIKVVDVGQPSWPTYVSRYQARGTLQQLRSKGAYLYAASGVGGLQVYDIKNPLNPVWVTGLDVEDQAQGLWVEDDRVYVAAGESGVVIVDISDPFYARQIGAVNTFGAARAVTADNGYLYIADDQAGLLVVDVRDPQRPVEVSAYEMLVQDMWLHKQTLWLLTDAGLSGWDVAGDGRLNQKITVPGEFVAVRAADDLVVAVTRAGIVKLWRRTPQGLDVLGQYASGDVVTGLQLDEKLLYLLGPRDGLQVVDIRQPELPQLVTIYPATGHHTRLVIARGAAFLAGETRLASVTLLPTLAVTVKSEKELSVQIPAKLPRGDYHLLAVGPTGQRQLFPNALKLQFAAPGEKNVTLDAFRQILKTPLKAPTESLTDLPSLP
ncbi:MAG: hypothetical protein GXP18_11505 [Gammaproteobacteria bacterium]|nr:hypothetical protein [Gammaproteobacteria bacterium]